MALWGVSKKKIFQMIKWLSCHTSVKKYQSLPFKTASAAIESCQGWRDRNNKMVILWRIRWYRGMDIVVTAVLQLQGNNADTIHLTLGWIGNIIHLRTFWSQMKKDKPNDWPSDIYIHWRMNVKIGQSFSVYPSESGIFLFSWFYIY